MKTGNMVRFKSSIVEKHEDLTNGSQLKLWRIGLLIEHNKKEKQVTIMHRNELLVMSEKKAQIFGKRYFESTEREIYEER